MNVDLGHLRSVPFTDIRQGERDLLQVRPVAADDRHVPVFEPGVTQAVPEREQHGLAEGVEITVAHVQALPVLHVPSGAGKPLIRRDVRLAQGKGLGELGARIAAPEQNIRHRRASALAA